MRSFATSATVPLALARARRGVAGDVAPIVGDARKQAAVFLPIAQHPPVAAVIGVKTKDPVRLLADVDAAVRSVDSTLPVYGAEKLSDAQVRSLGPKLLAVTLLGVFGFAVLVLSSVGIYAVVSQSLHERGQELRLRLTFGAAPRQLFVAELKRVGSVVIMSAAIGGAVAFGALRLLATTFPGFAGPVAIPLLVSTTTLIALALGTTTVPAYQACRRDVLNRV